MPAGFPKQKVVKVVVVGDEAVYIRGRDFGLRWRGNQVVASILAVAVACDFLFYRDGSRDGYVIEIDVGIAMIVLIVPTWLIFEAG